MKTVTIGGASDGAGNIIAFNDGDGVRVFATSASKPWPPVNICISKNSIFANTRLGINLVGDTDDADGVTPNDPGDKDGGPNGLQNYPVLTSAEGGSSLSVKGTLNSVPNATFTLELFSTLVAGSPKLGEGDTYMGSTSVQTDATGNVAFTFWVESRFALGYSITATATDSTGNTSEFSAPMLVGVTGIEQERDVPSDVVLMQNYPNPFNPSTMIRFGLPNRSHITLAVLNTLGQQVVKLLDGEMGQGYHEVHFDGGGLSSGVYFYRLEANSFVQTRKLLLIR